MCVRFLISAVRLMAGFFFADESYSLASKFCTFFCCFVVLHSNFTVASFCALASAELNLVFDVKLVYFFVAISYDEGGS